MSPRFLKWVGSKFRSFTIVGPDHLPYLTRYFIFECRWFKIYLHNFHRSDADRDKHDHPWPFTSIILSGGYDEELPMDIVRDCQPGNVIIHKASDLHMVKLKQNPDGSEIESWTLVFVGRKQRDWGFQTPEGWVYHKDYFDRKFGKGKWHDADEFKQIQKLME